MKKVLFGTTALVAASMFGTVAQAAEPIKLSVGGIMAQYFYFADVESEPYNEYGNFGTESDTEVHFKGSTVLDNGLKVAVTIEMEAERNVNADRNADQQFVTLSGGWGQVRVGEMLNAAQVVHTSAPGAGIAFSDVDSFLGDGLGTTGLANSYTSVDGIANAGRASNAIDYISPMFGPVAFGVTYTPNIANRGLADKETSLKDLLGVAGVYADKWGPVGVNFDIAYARFDAEGANGQLGQGMVHGVPVGLKFSYAGFEVGGSFFRIWDNAKVDAVATDGSLDGQAWDAGIAYTTGPWKFGYQYFSSSFEGAINTHGVDTKRMHNLGGQYTMGPGVVAVVNFAYETERNESGAADADKREAMGLITGLKLSF